MLFRVRGSALSQAGPRIALFTAISVLFTSLALGFGIAKYSLTVTPFTIIGLALSIFLGFRNNAAYDRFWEARKLWGSMVNTSRSFAREVLVCVGANPEGDADPMLVRKFQEDLIRRMIAYVHALRHLLRGTDPREDLLRFLPDEELQALAVRKNVPIALLEDIGLRLRNARCDGWLTDYQFGGLQQTLAAVTDVQGACERIRNTPIPFAYTVLTHRLVAFYCLFLPFGIIDTAGWLTPLVILLVSHALFGLDEIGNEIEEPFGNGPHHLPLAALCRTIEINLLQSIEEQEVPAFLEPVDGVLL